MGALLPTHLASQDLGKCRAHGMQPTDPAKNSVDPQRGQEGDDQLFPLGESIKTVLVDLRHR